MFWGGSKCSIHVDWDEKVLRIVGLPDVSVAKRFLLQNMVLLDLKVLARVKG